MTTTIYVINKVSMRYNENLCLFIVVICFTPSYVFVIDSLYQQICVTTLKNQLNEVSFIIWISQMTLYQAYMFQTERNLQTGSQDWLNTSFGSIIRITDFVYHKNLIHILVNYFLRHELASCYRSQVDIKWISLYNIFIP